MSPLPSPVISPPPGTDPVATSTVAYDHHSSQYAAWADTFSMAEPMDAFRAALRRGAAVLDAGCGTGRDLNSLQTAGVPALGVDLSWGMLAHASGPRAQADLRRLPFSDGAFGGVWSCASLVHLDPADVPDVLAEFARVTRSGGPLYVTVKAGDGEGQWVETEHGTRWFFYWEQDRFAEVVEAAGFSVRRCDESNPSWVALHALRTD